MGKASVTFRGDELLKHEFTAAAKASGRSAAELLRGFMREYVQRQAADYDDWFRR